MCDSEPRWDEGLTGPARNVAENTNAIIRVLAGPGTGKTFALMRRVARLLQDGVSPNRILICTFTRTAARDLQTELLALGISGIDRVIAGTIHSFCFRLLSAADILRLTQRTPRQLLKYEERILIEDIRGSDYGDVHARQRRLKAFNAAWARLQSDEPGWPSDPVDVAFHSDLMNWLRFHQAMLVGELIPLTLQYLRDNPASSYLTAFDHVLVDEYQDLNKAEQSLLNLLSRNGSLTIIGDEDQSIYSFKHAHPEGISTFSEEHDDTYDISLEVCRRCPDSVISVANHLISNNQSRASRALLPFDDNPNGTIHIVQWAGITEEANGLATYIESKIADGSVERGQVLVLAPRRQFGYAIRDALVDIGILAHSFFHEEAFDGNPKSLDDSKAQQANTLLTLLCDINDRVGLRCWCGFGSSSLRSEAWARLFAYCGDNNISPIDAINGISSGDISIPYTSDLVTRGSILCERLDELSLLTGDDLLDALFPEGEEWASPFRSIARRITTANYTASILKEAIRIGVTQPELPTDVDYVRIMSLHKAKGLTADLVIVAGCIEGLLPFIPTSPGTEIDRVVDEQRRLFYVAITRTRNILVLSSVTSLPRDIAHRMRATVTGGNETYGFTVASRFLAELGPTRPEPRLGTSVLPT